MPSMGRKVEDLSLAEAGAGRLAFWAALSGATHAALVGHSLGEPSGSIQHVGPVGGARRHSCRRPAQQKMKIKNMKKQVSQIELKLG